MEGNDRKRGGRGNWLARKINFKMMNRKGVCFVHDFKGECKKKKKKTRGLMGLASGEGLKQSVS